MIDRVNMNVEEIGFEIMGWV